MKRIKDTGHMKYTRNTGHMKHIKSQAPSPTAVFDPVALTKYLKREAKALDIPAGAAEVFIAKAIANTKSALAPRKIVTEQDIRRLIYKELKKYHPDFAYVYQNRDTII